MDRSPKLLAEFGAVAFVCRKCWVFQIEGDSLIIDKATSPGGNIREALRGRAAELAHRKREADRMAETVEAILTTPITDPRWIGWEVW
jgi:hypothetical protein